LKIRKNGRLPRGSRLLFYNALMTRNRRLLWLLLFLAALIFVAFLPPVRAHWEWRFENLRTRIKYALHPPDEAIFLPTIQPTQADTPPSPTPSPSSTPFLAGEPTLPPTATPTPLPDSVSLEGVVCEDQFNRWNYCGPSNLAMALEFWGWEGNRDDVAKSIKPGVDDPALSFIDRGKTDKNVMPYEMANFVNEETSFHALIRYGGEISLVKRLLAAGFPVLAEKGYYERDYTGKISWMGHYQFITGYDDAEGVFIVQDTYHDGPDFRVPYDEFWEGWRAFDYLFLLVYPPEREENLLSVLGDWGDPMWAAQHALDIAERDIQTQTGNDSFFAWFNKGTSLVKLQRYADAAAAYDQAFLVYAQLEEEDTQRPYRMMWYQTGPYWAYYYSGRYQDVINLANITLNETISKPTLEESLYWRAMAEYALGQRAAALEDMREAVHLNPHFFAGLTKLQEWGD